MKVSHTVHIAVTFLLIQIFCIAAIMPQASGAKNPKVTYFNAENEYIKLKKSSRRVKYRDNWIRIIRQFHDVYEADPKGPWAAAGLYKEASLYEELYNISSREADKGKAVILYRKIKNDYPRSRYRMPAIKALNELGEDTTVTVSTVQRIKVKKPLVTINKPPKITSTNIGIINPARGEVANTGSNCDPILQETDDEEATRDSKSTISGLRYWSNPNYTRVVIDADKSTSYYHHMLKKDPSINKPQRLFIDIQNSIIGASLKKKIPIDDHLLKAARAAQNTADSVRVVIDIKSYKNYKIFSLRNPFRIVIDVWGDADKNHIVSSRPQEVNIPESNKLPPGALAKQFALGVKTIVIDPGHGGKDYGAKGYYSGVHEKYVVLDMAKLLAKKIREELKCNVIMTRTDDRYITLEERTAIANTQNADLFISIHTNAHHNKNAYGIETYFLNLATDDSAVTVAARENATSTKNISDLQSILDSLMQNAKINESSRLAGFVQNSLITNLEKKYSKIKNKGVKQAPFYVLLGAQMPAILIEAPFISNPRECKRLTSESFQKDFCQYVITGIQWYIQSTTPTAFRKDYPSDTKT